MRLNMTCLAPLVAATEKTPVKVWEIHPRQEYVIPIQKTVGVFLCLKFYLQISVFMIVPIALPEAAMTFSVLHLRLMRWLI